MTASLPAELDDDFDDLPDLADNSESDDEDDGNNGSENNDDTVSDNSFDNYVADFYREIQPTVASYFHIDAIEHLYDPQYPEFENYINQSLVCALNRSNGDMFCTKCRCGLRGHFCEVMMKAGSGIDQLRNLQDKDDPDVAPPVTTSSKLKILFCYMSANKLI